jgi:predicted transcriptional regulator of viral defense system
MVMEKIIEYFKKNGYARMKELKKVSIPTRDISRLLKQDIIHKIKPGLYRLNDIPDFNGISSSIIDICQAIPKGVICLISALDFYDLTTFNPFEIYVAVPQGDKIHKIIYPPVKGYYFSRNLYESGIQVFNTPYGPVKIYNREKTICDMFRYRNKLGEDLALEGLKNYLELSGSSINKLRKYAKICHVDSIIYPYLKALVV